jgi:hypothetical protein
MAADAALTKKVDFDRKIDYQKFCVTKLHRIKELSAGISSHGIGLIGDTRLDLWLTDFITKNAGNHDSIRSFGVALAEELGKRSPPIKATLGFHLAGFEQSQDGGYPTAYRILSEAADGKFNCRQMEPPHKYQKGARKTLRGGETAIFANAFDLLEKLLKSYAPIMGTPDNPMQIPFPDNLKMRAEYLRFQILVISDIYALSNQVEWIDAPVTTLTISSDGSQEYLTCAAVPRKTPYSDLELLGLPNER